MNKNKTPPKLTGLIEGLNLSGRSSGNFAPLSYGAKEEPSSNTMALRLDLIDESPLPPRVVYTKFAEDELEASMSANGQQEAIHVRPHPERAGRFIVVDGQTRLNVFRRGNLGNTIRAENHPEMTDTEAFWFGFRQNKDRSQPTDLDLGMSLHKMMQASGMTQEALAEQAGIKPAVMSALMAYAEMPEAILAAILNSSNPAKISYNLAGAIRSLLNTPGITMDTAVEFVTKVISLDMTVKEATALKANLAKQVGEVSKPVNKKQAFASFDGYGDLVTRKNALTLNLTGLSPEKVEAVANAIKETLDNTL